MTVSPLIEARAVLRRAARTAATLLGPLDFSLGAGERVAVIGRSGSGKSVFMRVLAMLDPSDGGELLWHGRRVERHAITRYRRSVAYVQQRPALIDGTVEDNLRYPYSLRAYRDARFDREHAARLVAAAGKDADFLSKRASDLSGGEGQVAALIRVLQLAPEVLLLDEPTASLDPQSARAIESLVQAWFDADRAARASIWVSHDPAQAERVGERRLTMHAGTLTDHRETRT
ncbi:ABC transporter ATP-binding protein [Trinickia dabaoshanensis]|uniref:ABC transporter ATP-binding protein n=1 Tax=Trinickia dabaoshanensis TaxID=564714 RepID=A0A2N7VGW2_9BURK|nr:ATP-binding cassette domain-containing protein [Trinickia dabaoshanensis]PMS16379.1 ABC transporter ATP-binding protein [Trinickia dabaoshanensis]